MLKLKSHQKNFLKQNLPKVKADEGSSIALEKEE